MQVRCTVDSCDKKVIKYNDLIEHRKYCFVEKIPCIYGCGVKLKGKEQHRVHARLEC